MATRRLSLRAYARYRDVAPSAVHLAIKYGRLTSWSCRRGSDGWSWEIDPVRADREWVRNTDPYVGGRRT